MAVPKEVKQILVDKSVSFALLRDAGYEIQTTEFEKGKYTRVKIESVKRDGKWVSRDELSKLLYTVGLDTNNARFWVEARTTHRPYEHLPKVVSDYRFGGYERYDLEWTKSGLCSMDMFLKQSNFTDTEDEVNATMGKQTVSVETGVQKGYDC